jgi:hypothetical protein
MCSAKQNGKLMPKRVSVNCSRTLGFRDYLILAALFLATVHCVRSIFFVNVSYVDLVKYGAGTERMPYQGRVAMMPVIRYAGHSTALERAAGFFDRAYRTASFQFSNPPERITPEKLACIVMGLLATLLATSFLVYDSLKRSWSAWWLSSALFLAMLYISYAARYEAPFWYPYDLPHIALFGCSALCILNGWYIWAFCFFMLDIPMRETSLFLIPVLLAVGYAKRLRTAFVWATAMLALWLPIHFIIDHHFAGSPSEANVHFYFIKVALLNPFHWPQIASAFGFLLLPLVLNFGKLNRTERFFVFGAIPGVLMTTMYGVWFESRIWDEWLIPFAVLLSLQTMRILRSDSTRRSLKLATHI